METISELKVMRSAAGWYIGRSSTEDDSTDFSMPLSMPYSRESGYYATEDEAEKVLADIHRKGSTMFIDEYSHRIVNRY